MKRLYFLLFLFLFAFACRGPEKLLEKGNYDQAFQQSLKKLSKSQKIKSKDVQILEEVNQKLVERDRAQIEQLRAGNKPSNWPKVHEKCLEVADRQAQLKPMVEYLNASGYTPSISYIKKVKEWLAEAEEQSAIYFYDQAWKHIPTAREGDRLAARKAFDDLDRCRYYQLDFEDAEELEDEMYELGTVHILVNPIEERFDFGFSRELFEEVLGNNSFPFREDWQVYHLREPDKVPLHYRVDLVWDDIFTSGDLLQSSVNNCQAEIEEGFRIVQEWSPQDSAYVEKEEPIYITVTAQVTNYYQEKSARISLDYFVIDTETEEIIDSYTFYESADWDNKYAVVSGDNRALQGQCGSAVGVWEAYPADEYLLLEAADDLEWSFYRRLKRDLE